MVVKDIDPYKGIGLFSTQAYQTGECIYQVRIEKYKAVADKYSVQLEADKHFDATGDYLANMNHHCDANVNLQYQDEVLSLIANRPIQSSEELTFNYLTTEYDMATPFNCQCGATQCFGEVKGFRYLNKEQQQQLNQQLLDYLKQQAA